MQAQGNVIQGSMMGNFINIYQQEGTRGLWKVQRASFASLKHPRLRVLQLAQALFFNTQIFKLVILPFFLLQGVSLTAQRAAIVVGVELPVYDITKKHLIMSGYMGDTVYTHFV